MSKRKVCHACVSLPRDSLCGVCDAPADDVRAVGDEPVAIGTLHRDCDERIVFESCGEIHVKDGMGVFSHPRRPDTLNAVLSWILGPGSEEDPMTFLRCWTEGKFDLCREEWPQAPKECYP